MLRPLSASTVNLTIPYSLQYNPKTKEKSNNHKNQKSNNILLSLFSRFDPLFLGS
jgi:hypothetical protein